MSPSKSRFPLLSAIWATAAYEFDRSLVIGRIAVMSSMALFPPAMTLIVIAAGAEQLIELPLGISAYLICVLASLVWSTTAVSAELEGKSWQYGSSRPGGRIAIAMGKYLVSCLWTFVVTSLALTGAIAVQAILAPSGAEVRTWFVLVSCAFAGSLAYGAVFLLLGTIFNRRAMVAGIVYGVVFELILASLPALVKYLTVRYPIGYIAAVGLLPKEFIESPEFGALYSDFSVSQAILSLLFLLVLTLGSAMVIVRFREFITSEES